MGTPSSSIYISHIICISPIGGNHINTKTKSHHAPAPKAPPLYSKSYDVRRPYVELLLLYSWMAPLRPSADIPHVGTQKDTYG